MPRVQQDPSSTDRRRTDASARGSRASPASTERPWIELGDWPNSPQGRERAGESAKYWSERFRERGVGAAPSRPPGETETVAEYSIRWLEERERRKLSSVGTDRSRFKTHVEPVIGSLPIRKVTRSDVERLVEDLDSRVVANKLSWKTALNVWALVVKLFDDAHKAKALSLRVLDRNPAADVRGPDRGVRKAKVYLYPDEFLRFASSDRVPVSWRRLVTLAIYTGTRASELGALEWDDVDLLRGAIHVHRALTEEGEAKTTKTDAARRFPIEPHLLPLLDSCIARPAVGAVSSGYPTREPRELAPSLSRARGHRPNGVLRHRRDPEGDHAPRLARDELHVAPLRGDDPLKIKQRAGHDDFKTTEGYIREAENLEDNIGEPFPPCPPRCSRLWRRRRSPVEVWLVDRNELSRRIVETQPKYREIVVRRGGLEPP